jgi:copper chaperone CopZ
MRIIPSLCVSASLLILIGCATPADPADQTPVSGTAVVLTVYGMSCPLCSNNIDGQLEKIDGVESVHIDLDTGAVTVGLTEGHSVTHEQLESAVKAAGFTLAGTAEK